MSIAEAAERIRKEFGRLDLFGSERCYLEYQEGQLFRMSAAQLVSIYGAVKAWGSTPWPEFYGRISRRKGSKPNGGDAASGSGRSL